MELWTGTLFVLKMKKKKQKKTEITIIFKFKKIRLFQFTLSLALSHCGIFNFCSVCGNENKDYTGTLLRDQKKSHNQKIQRHTALQK